MDLLFFVSTPEAARILVPLAAACRRARRPYACFFTDAGVATLDAAAVRDSAAGAERAVACEESWHRFRATAACPVELGSQTDNSALAGSARHVLSL
jgi:hypothetical protein